MTGTIEQKNAILRKIDHLCCCVLKIQLKGRAKMESKIIERKKNDESMGKEEKVRKANY